VLSIVKKTSDQKSVLTCAIYLKDKLKGLTQFNIYVE
jgi:hypothetical protein